MNTTEQLFIRACKGPSDRKKMMKRFDSIIRRYYYYTERDNKYFVMHLLSTIVSDRLKVDSNELIHHYEEIVSKNNFLKIDEKPDFIEVMISFLINKIRFCNAKDIKDYRPPSKFMR